jgi:hypothetical protein
MNSAEHPVWPFLSETVKLICLTIILAVFADNFDYTEWRTIATMVFACGGIEFLRHKKQVQVASESRQDCEPVIIRAHQENEIEPFPKLSGDQMTGQQT